MVQETVRDLLESRQFEHLARSLTAMNPVDVAELLDNVSPEQAAVAFRLLPKDFAVQVFEQMEPDQQSRLLEAFTTEGARELIEAMSPDDRAALLEEVPAMVARRLLQLLSPREREATLTLLGYEEGTAGRVMTPHFVDLRKEMTVAQALDRIRRLAIDRETIYDSYVMDDERRLLGTVSLRSLVLAPPNAKVGDIMVPNPKAVTTSTDQEEVARVLRDYDLLAVPVVDSEGRLVGIVTHDDVVDIMEREATEDIYRLGAVPSTEREYFTTSIVHVARRRVIWLFLLILVNTVTGSIIAGQSELLEQVVVLAAFVPLLIGTGGNVGAQSSTVVIRGLATGEISPRRAALIVAREVGIGVLLGLVLGVLVLGWAYLIGRDARVSLIVGVTLVAIASMAAMTGAALPFLFRLLRVDPAMVSAPFITTVMDIFGVVLYFLIAHLLLRL